MAVNDYTPPRAAANSARAITLDLRAINNAAADIHEIQHTLARLGLHHLSDFEFLSPDDLIRCRVLLAEVERVVASEVRS